MLTAVLWFFGIGALLGLFMATHVLRDKLAPWWVSVVHALLGAIGLIILIVMMVQGSTMQRIVVGFIVLLIAALGGFFLASFHLRKKLPPKAVVYIHAALAIIGFLILLSLVL